MQILSKVGIVPSGCRCTSSASAGQFACTLPYCSHNCRFNGLWRDADRAGSCCPSFRPQFVHGFQVFTFVIGGLFIHLRHQWQQSDLSANQQSAFQPWLTLACQSEFNGRLSLLRRNSGPGLLRYGWLATSTGDPRQAWTRMCSQFSEASVSLNTPPYLSIRSFEPQKLPWQNQPGLPWRRGAGHVFGVCMVWISASLQCQLKGCRLGRDRSSSVFCPGSLR